MASNSTDYDLFVRLFGEITGWSISQGAIDELKKRYRAMSASARADTEENPKQEALFCLGVILAVCGRKKSDPSLGNSKPDFLSSDYFHDGRVDGDGGT